MNFKEYFMTYCDDLPGMIKLSEEISKIGELPPEKKNAMYNHYVQTYSDKGLKPWTRTDYDWRAEQWLAAGNLPQVDETGQEIEPEKVGFVTARDHNGIVKFTGMQGPNARAKVRGLMELVALNKPMWGAMDKEFVEKLRKMGFSTPPPGAMKKLYPVIQKDSQFSSGGSWGEMGEDGGINFNLSGVGNTVKYFTGNKLFFRWMIDKHGAKMGLSPDMLGKLGQWKSLPGMAKAMMMPMLQAKGLDPETLDWMADIMSDDAAPAPKTKPEPTPEPTASPQPSPGLGMA